MRSTSGAKRSTARIERYRPKGWLRFEEVAAELGCSVASARQRAYCGPLVAEYVRGEVMVREKELARYVRGMR